MRTPRLGAKMGTAQRNANTKRLSQCSSDGDTLEEAFARAKQDMILLIQDELVLKKDIQDVQQLFQKIMSQLDDVEKNRTNNRTTESSMDCPPTYARTNLNRNHNVHAQLGLGQPQIDVNKYRIQSLCPDDESSSSYQTESSLYPSDSLPTESDYSKSSSTSSRSSRKKKVKRALNETYVIEPAKSREPSILDKSTFFDHTVTDLDSYHRFMPALCSTFAGNLTNATNLLENDDEVCPPLTSAASMNRHLRNKKNNSSYSCRDSLCKKGILKNSYHRACLTNTNESDTTESPRDNANETSIATYGNTTLGTRPSPVGAYSYELTQNVSTLRRRTKVRFEDISSATSDESCDSFSSHTTRDDSCDDDQPKRTKRLTKKPPTPMKGTPRSRHPEKPADTSSDSDADQSTLKRVLRRQVSFAESVKEPSSFEGYGSDTSLWLENSNEVFVDYETERQAHDTTHMVEIEETLESSSASEEECREPVKLPWLPQLLFDITEDSFKATLEELEKADKIPDVFDNKNVTYNDNFALIAQIEKEFMKCREDGSSQVEKPHEDYVNPATTPVNVSLNESFPMHEMCQDHDVHLALGEPCSFYLEDTLTLLENSKLFDLHCDQLSESGFESTHNLDSSQTDASSIASEKPAVADVSKDAKANLAVPQSLEVTRDSTPDMTCVQSPEESEHTRSIYEENVHTMCEMNFQGAPDGDYCESINSSTYSSSSGVGSHNSSGNNAVNQMPYNTPATSADPTPDSSIREIVAPFATPATSISEDMITRTDASGSSIPEEETTLLNPPQSQTLFNLGISPISSKASAIDAVAVPMNSPCASEDEADTIRKQLFMTQTQTPVAPKRRSKLVRSQLFKIVQRSNSKIRGKKPSIESSKPDTAEDRQAVYKKKRDLKKKLKMFSSLFHRKDKDAMNQIQTLAHI